MCLSVIMKELLLVVVKLLASEKHRMSHHSRVKKISTSAGVNLTQFMREYFESYKILISIMIQFISNT